MNDRQVSRVWLIGESNPYQSEPRPEYDLYPSPPQSAGARLCRILGHERRSYLRTFKRRNLIYGAKWSVPAAREAAAALLREATDGDALVLLGSKVAAAFGLPFEALTAHRVGALDALIIPHPSGLSRAWNDPTMAPRVRDAVAKLLESRGAP